MTARPVKSCRFGRRQNVYAAKELTPIPCSGAGMPVVLRLAPSVALLCSIELSSKAIVPRLRKHAASKPASIFRGVSRPVNITTKTIHEWGWPIDWSEDTALRSGKPQPQRRENCRQSIVRETTRVLSVLTSGPSLKGRGTSGTCCSNGAKTARLCRSRWNYSLTPWPALRPGWTNRPLLPAGAERAQARQPRLKAWVINDQPKAKASKGRDSIDDIVATPGAILGLFQHLEG